MLQDNFKYDPILGLTSWSIPQPKQTNERFSTKLNKLFKNKRKRGNESDNKGNI